jgi:hypothetical protein
MREGMCVRTWKYGDGLEDGWSLGFDAGIEESYGGNSEKDNQ